ncbi:1-acyl-sn-glycerol-3-phosphate acyltransferase beta [Amyelois transitella]|uniref:1-acyl-sn-glycerol-3-phosphate acyltransferase beta n=1 Tax=Amyelois transitella TaxID=680683 RepID=UPI00298FA28B|nr:1-acyl-sn-glycerol-3-phosphate acyltransferase beta [Amyelois transitella]XP_060809444.1 1-acyl-sn-glycerol-3-phosphate acyltransferase beta [Amyelois transitella]XP_060809450.1 1-acyl-sn-glycerol-3-phosphate acyltransferase beta [Amyelois transitella]XP_060809455.1 1-acyl-sn-glycerol-3-phosphate acyltransferase beta [Amyelois transitella]
MFRHWNVAQNMTVVVKKELYYFWPFGLAASLAGVVFIDRSQPKAAYKSMKTTMHVMQDNKTKIWVFPEGTRNKKINQFLPFKKGAFAIAVAAQVPIIPVVYSPYYFINDNKYIFAKGHIIMQCLEPVSTKGLTENDIPALIEIVREKMFTTFKELRKEVLNSLPVDYPYSIEC